MKALVYTAPETLAYRDEPEPARLPGDVMVKVEAVGICGSDMHAFHGHDARRPAPLILGHEAAGAVIEGARKGETVVVNPLVTCGACEDCLSGRSNICAAREIISIAPRQGAFAEYIAIPERNLIKVPDGMNIAKAALTEPVATGWRAACKAAGLAQKPLGQSRALVFGGGAVGLAAALSLRAQGCGDIMTAETNAKRRATAERAGAGRVFDPAAEDGGAAENSADIVIDCVGADATRGAASRAARPGGVIVHVGLAAGGGGLDVRKMTLHEITFAGSYTYTMEDFQAALNAMNTGALGALDWFEERPLAEGAAAFDDLAGGHSAAAKIVLRPGNGA